MLKTILILSSLLSFTAQAVCLEPPFTETGFGFSPSEAMTDAKKQADLKCEVDEFFYFIEQKTEFLVRKINSYEFEASASFRCCTQW